MVIKTADSSALSSKMVEAALAHGDAKARVLVYVRTPELAEKVQEGITKRVGESATKRVHLLTGTLRGKERDDLASGIIPEFRADPNRGTLRGIDAAASLKRSGAFRREHSWR